MSDPIIKLEDVSKSYSIAEETMNVLDAVNLSVNEGEFVVVRGVSGSGKSTLLNLIGGIDKPSKGEVKVCGDRVSQMTNQQLTVFRRTNIGFVFQFYNLLPTLTSLENIQLGLEASKKDAGDILSLAEKYLNEVGLSNKADKFPSQLSGGEQQRVAIARAMAKEPKIILADEPTGNLDDDSGKKVLELLKKLQKEEGVTVIVVTHDANISNFADRSLLLKDKKLSA